MNDIDRINNKIDNLEMWFNHHTDRSRETTNNHNKRLAKLEKIEYPPEQPACECEKPGKWAVLHQCGESFLLGPDNLKVIMSWQTANQLMALLNEREDYRELCEKAINVIQSHYVTGGDKLQRDFNAIEKARG